MRGEKGKRGKNTLRNNVQSRIVMAVRKSWAERSVVNTPPGSSCCCRSLRWCKRGLLSRKLIRARRTMLKELFSSWVFNLDEEFRIMSTAVATRASSPDTRLSGQNPPFADFTSLSFVDDFIACKAHVRHRLAPAGAEGDCVNHFGLNSTTTAIEPSSSAVGVISVINVPYSSSSTRYVPCRRAGLVRWISIRRSCWLQSRIRAAEGRKSVRSTRFSGGKSGRITLSKYFCESITGAAPGRALRNRISCPSRRGSVRNGGISDGGGVVVCLSSVSKSRLDEILGLGGGWMSR